MGKNLEVYYDFSQQNMFIRWISLGKMIYHNMSLSQHISQHFNFMFVILSQPQSMKNQYLQWFLNAMSTVVSLSHQ